MGFVNSRKLREVEDHRLLRLLLDALEAIGAADNATARRDAMREARRLVDAVHALPQLEGYRFVGEMHTQLGAVDALDDRALTALLVPLERALDRRLRDEDFLPVRDRTQAASATMPVTVVCDSLRSSFNVGGVFRSSECFGAEALVLTGYSATPEDPRVAKAAMGTSEQVPWSKARRIDAASAALRESGAFILALESEAQHPRIDDVELRFPCAVLLGNERFGLESAVLESADAVARIELFGRKNSLNVVSALSVCLYEIRRRWQLEQSAQ